MNSNEASRRDFLKASVVGAAVGTLGVLCGRAVGQAAEAEKLKVAGYPYDRVQGIVDGRVGIDGADVSFHFENIYSLNNLAFSPEPTYEVTELGLIPYVTKYINEDFRAYTLIPVFILRAYRHRNVYVHTDAGIETPADLRGKRMATPGYGMSASTWIRGFLLDEHGVRADEMQWIETTQSSDGGAAGGSGFSAFDAETSPYFLPADFPLVQGPPDIDESELLLNGDCDALITALPPKAFLEGDPRIRPLFPDARAAEQEYFRKTGLFPIMHAIGVRTDAIDANPELPKAVFEMYSRAKQIAYDTLNNTGALMITLPWGAQELEDTRRLMGENFWQYGIDANRKELELVMRYTHEQGLVKQRLEFEELFHSSTMQLEEVAA